VIAVSTKLILHWIKIAASELQTECALIIPSLTMKCNFYNCTDTSELLNRVLKHKSENCSLWSCIHILSRKSTVVFKLKYQNSKGRL